MYLVVSIEEMDDPLVPFRSELRAHCYRMLGSHHDAEDVLQEVSLRAWRGLEGFEGRSSKRTWLHRIAHNACLTELGRKERRVLPVDVMGEANPGAEFAEPDAEVLWLQPFPDDPGLDAEQGESLELAFVAAVQHLTANQRAVLLLFDVLGFSSAEVAELMAITRASVTSALQRPSASLDPNPLAGIVDDGFVNAIDGNTDRAVTFWFLATGVVLFIVGHLTHWVVRRTGRIPALVGWWTLGLAVPSLVLLPTSPFWLALAIGVFALVAARRDDQAAVELPTS